MFFLRMFSFMTCLISSHFHVIILKSHLDKYLFKHNMLHKCIVVIIDTAQSCCRFLYTLRRQNELLRRLCHLKDQARGFRERQSGHSEPGAGRNSSSVQCVVTRGDPLYEVGLRCDSGTFVLLVPAL